MSDVKILQHGTDREIVTAGSMHIQPGHAPISFSYGDASATVRFELEPRARDHLNNLIGMKHPEALSPYDDSLRPLGAAELRVLLEPVVRAPTDPRGKAFVLHYEVTIPAEPAATTRRAA